MFLATLIICNLSLANAVMSSVNPYVVLDSKQSRKKRRRPKNMVRDFTKRQVSKRWLETHLWHAKRMHMENMWGYRLAKRPCDKSFRSTYRAFLHLCNALKHIISHTHTHIHTYIQ